MPAILALLLLTFASPAASAPAVTCHCFRDRAFDPQRPAVVDPYLLATVQNSLFAEAFGVEKKDVLRSKMAGTSHEDLWVAHTAARQTGLGLGDLLRARGCTGNWREALAGLGVGPEQLAGALASTLQGGASDAALASAAVNDVLAGDLGVPPGEVARLREEGATDAEAVAAALLSAWTGEAPAVLRQRVRMGAETWGALFHRSGLEPSALGDEVKRLLR